MIDGVWQITFAPYVPWPLLAAAGAVALVLVVMSLTRGAGGALARLLAFAVVLLALANPRHVEEQRRPERDVALLVVDHSASQHIGKREAQTDAAVSGIRARLANDPSIEVREVDIDRYGVHREDYKESAQDSSSDRVNGGTNLFGPLRQAAAAIPPARYAGTIIVSDGQVHDVPAPKPGEGKQGYAGQLPDGPIHILISGERNQYDRRLVIEDIPAYAIVGKTFKMIYEVVDNGKSNKTGNATNGAGHAVAVPVELRINGIVQAQGETDVGQKGSFQITLDHAGASIIEVTTPTINGELSATNNTAVATVNGVRDRLRVLLISGQPHAGERTWRNLLKSDPAVDLVHFTILRPPNKSDFTPIRELALIAFPTYELFDLKLKDFDLVVFDRYVVRFVLSSAYFQNIRDYVIGGGALMFAVGPEYASNLSLYDTPLGDIAPARPTGGVIEKPFRPALTKLGERHPVTAGLTAHSGAGHWGRWMRQIPVERRTGEVLMKGVDGLPLLVLSRVGKGRVGLLASDQIWLWARDFDGGGPHAELIRRTAHWLMREPSLEEERLHARLKGQRIEIFRQTLADSAGPVTVNEPDGQQIKTALKPAGEGVFSASIGAEGPGIYRFTSGNLSAQLAVGDADPIEYRDLRATDERLAPLAKASGGTVNWLVDGVPEIRRPRDGRDMAGRNWIGLRANHSYVVTGLSDRPLLPGWLVAALATGFLFAAWWRESHSHENRQR